MIGWELEELIKKKDTYGIIARLEDFNQRLDEANKAWAKLAPRFAAALRKQTDKIIIDAMGEK